MKTITDYLESLLQEEIDKLWADGTLNEEKVESFRTLHERTPYHKVFTKLFEETEIAKFTPTELKEYEDSLKAYRDVKNSIDTALEKGREEGRAEGREEGRVEGVIQVAKKLLESGMDVDTIMKMTDLSKSEIEKL